MAILDDAKLAMRSTTNAYNAEISRLLAAGAADLGVVDIDASDTTDALIAQALITYVRAHFGTPEDYDRLKASYDEQKAQMMTAKGYGFPIT